MKEDRSYPENYPDGKRYYHKGCFIFRPIRTEPYSVESWSLGDLGTVRTLREGVAIIDEAVLTAARQKED
jgi:hypothetical protein